MADSKLRDNEKSEKKKWIWKKKKVSPNDIMNSPRGNISAMGNNKLKDNVKSKKKEKKKWRKKKKKDNVKSEMMKERLRKKKKFSPDGISMMKINLRKRRSMVLPEKIMKMPLFNIEYAIRDGLDEYNGWSLGDLLYFLESLIFAFDDGFIMWNELELPPRWKDTTEADCERLWNKLKGNLQPRTLKESLLAVRKSIMFSYKPCTLMAVVDKSLIPKCPVHEWPTLPHAIMRFKIENEVTSSLGELPGNSSAGCFRYFQSRSELDQAVGPPGRSYLLTKRDYEIENYLSSVAECFRKYPKQCEYCMQTSKWRNKKRRRERKLQERIIEEEESIEEEK